MLGEEAAIRTVLSACALKASVELAELSESVEIVESSFELKNGNGSVNESERGRTDPG